MFRLKNMQAHQNHCNFEITWRAVQTKSAPVGCNQFNAI